MYVLLHVQLQAQVVISGQLKKWHKVTLTFSSGITASETDAVNPFTDFRLNVTFTKGNARYLVAGYYAADGDAANTGAVGGDKWRVHFCPPETGTWTYAVSFRTGPYIAVSDTPLAGTPVHTLDGLSGSFDILPTDKTGSDFRAKGRLQYAGGHHLRFAETGEYFLKGGAGSPENFLAYHEFDGTYDDGGVATGLPAGLHQYAVHTADWHAGDPAWRNGKGKAIIGALNYLASQGVNSLYFLVMNIDGDGDDVWPYVSPSPSQRDRFDVSKLDQWEIVFHHMDSVGIALHLFTSERENQMLLDNGNMGNLRKLFYRELIARFSHHLAVLWNMGEENGRPYLGRGAQNDWQRMEMAEYFKTHDPYKNFVTVHNYTPDVQLIYTPLLGYPFYDGMSLQAFAQQVNNITTQWRNNSAASGHNWVIFHDETAGGIDPDGAAGSNHALLRKNALWGNLMGGGGGVEWYFGNNDLNAEDFRSRSDVWKFTRHALTFFQTYLPFWKMTPHDNLTSSGSDFVLELPGEVYAIYLPHGNTTAIDLPSGDYSVYWYSPVSGGPLVHGSLPAISGGSNVFIGNPPSAGDWAALIVSNAYDLCDDGTLCTADTIINGSCLHIPLVCDDGDLCTSDSCGDGTCFFTPVPGCCTAYDDCDDHFACSRDYCHSNRCVHDTVSIAPSYLRVINHAQSWRKLKLGYGPVSLWSPKLDVAAGGNDRVCITLRDSSGSADWSKIQFRPQGDGDHAVTLSDFLPAGAAAAAWTEVCIPFFAFGTFSFSKVSYLEFPYSAGAPAFEIDIQRIVFTGGTQPLLWFGDPKTDNFFDTYANPRSSLDATLMTGQSCIVWKQSAPEPLGEPFIAAYPNPFSDLLNIGFIFPDDASVRVELLTLQGSIARICDQKMQGGQSGICRFNASDLPEGLYLYRILTSRGQKYNGKVAVLKQVR